MEKKMKIVVFTFSLFISSFGFSQQTPEQIDSANVYLRDSLYNIKSTFIGKPFANLADALSNNFSFSLPSGSNRTRGMGYYKTPSIFLNSPVGVPLSGFGLEFAAKMPVDLGKMRAVGLDQWDKLMRTYLRTAIIIEMTKID